MEFVSKSTFDTEEFAASLAERFPSPQVFCLTGDLGAGKTAFTRGLARGYGFMGRVSSPTFAIMNVYEGGREKINHFDLYRLESDEELEDIGFDECLKKDISVIEWPDNFMHLIDSYTLVTITKTDNDDERIIRIGEENENSRN